MDRDRPQVVGMTLGQNVQLFLECLRHCEVAQRALVFQGLLEQRQLIERMQTVGGAHDVPRFLERRCREGMLALRCQEIAELGQGRNQLGRSRAAFRLCGDDRLADALSIGIRLNAVGRETEESPR
jgi:hypothetical protein